MEDVLLGAACLVMSALAFMMGDAARRYYREHFKPRGTYMDQDLVTTRMGLARYVDPVIGVVMLLFGLALIIRGIF